MRSIIRRGYRHVADLDLSNFFDRVQHDVLMSRVARKVKDDRLLRLIGNYLLRTWVRRPQLRQSTPSPEP